MKIVGDQEFKMFNEYVKYRGKKNDPNNLEHSKWLAKQHKKINAFECDQDTDMEEVTKSSDFLLRDLR